MLNKNQRLKANLAHSAHSDALTQAKNYADNIDDLFQNGHSNQWHLSMMMFDIDHFEHIKDEAAEKVMNHN